MNNLKLFAFFAAAAVLAVFYLGVASVSNHRDNHEGTVKNVTAAQPATPAPDLQKIAERYGEMPIHFEPNVGQTDEAVKFTARGDNYSMFLTDTETVLALEKRGNKGAKGKSAILSLRLENANSSPASTGIGETEGRSNYFVGNDPAKWHADVPNFAKVKYSQVYPGIDAVYYGTGRQLEYDFNVEPGVDPSQIKITFSGADNARLENGSGDLLLDTGVGTIRQLKPFVYQENAGEKSEIASSYRIERREKGSVTVSFNLAEYDRSKSLTIDPVLAYGSYLGGVAFDEGRSIAVDAAGNAYIVGTAASRDFPTTAGTVKPQLLPRTDSSDSFWYDAFVTKVNPSGTALVFSTYFGGRNGSESGSGVAIDAAGNVIISGTTMANDMPTVNAFQSAFGGTDDAFAAKLNPSGSAIIYSTYLGGNNTDLGGKIAVNAGTGDTVFAGVATSGNFPTTPGVLKPQLCNNTPGSCNGIFYSGSYVVKLSASGNAIYSTLFDATLNDVALDAADNAVVAGSAGSGFPTTSGAFQPASSGGIDGIVAKVNPNGSAITFGTYLGGGLQSDRINGIALDAAGDMFVTGQTQNTAFPTTAGAFDQTFNGGEDGFVTKFNPTGSALVYSTFLGGTGKDQPFGIGINSDGDAFVAGETLSSATFPLRNSINGTNGQIFLTRLNPTATALVYSTLLGSGGAYDVAVDAASNAYITGHTTSIPVTPTAFQPMKGEATSTGTTKDAFVIKIAPADESLATYSISGTVNDPTQFGNYQPIVVTVTGPVSRSIVLPYGSGNGVIPYYFGNLPAGGTYTVTARKQGFTTLPENVVFTNLGANQFADFTIQPNQKPEGVITTPTHGTTYNAPASIVIQATASDPDGDAIAKVDFVAYSSTRGTVNLGTDTTAPYEFTWTNAPVDTWGLYAIPTDSKGLRGDSTPVVQVQVVDPSPVSVAITSPAEGQAFVQGNYVPIAVSVSASTTVVEVRDQNNEMVGRMIQAPWQTTWRVMNTGSYTLTATATNSVGQTAVSQPVTFVVNPIDHRITGTIRDSITTNGLPGVTLRLTSPTNPSITATATTDSTGAYVFTGLGATPNDGVVITPSKPGYSFSPLNRSIGFLGYIDWDFQNFTAVPDSQIAVAVTSPADGQIFTAPATINIAANASSGAGTITKVEFYRERGASTQLIGTDTTAPYEFQWTNVDAWFNYGIFARAIDSTGAAKDSELVRVTVNQAPSTVRLQGEVHNPGGGPMAGITVNLTGTAGGGPITQSYVTNVNGAYGFFSVPVGGNYTITPQGVGGMTFTPPSVTVNNASADQFDINFVSSGVNQAPAVQINSPADGAVFSMPASIPVNVTASDPDGQIAHLTVSAQGRSQVFTIGQSNNGTFNAPWQPTLPGSYTITAQARDNGGLLTTASIAITVNQPAPTSISGRIVDRGSVGLEGVTLVLKDYPQEAGTVATVTTDANGNYSIPNVTTFSSYVLRASKQDYAFSPAQRLYLNISASQTNADFTGTLQVQPSDFDGDGSSDFAVWRPSTGVWHVSRSIDQGYYGQQFGGGSFGDVVVPGNYDGDKKTDYAVYRGGTWFIQRSSDGTVMSVQFGIASDIPVAGDFDGDGKTDIAVWRGTSGDWYILKSSNGGFDAFHFGSPGDKPLAGDYDGDGKSDITIFRPSTGSWYISRSSDGSMMAGQFGTAEDKPLVGDFDGDKRADITVWRPSTGVWYTQLTADGSYRFVSWGTMGDRPVPGDFDHDGKTDRGVFREATGDWYVLYSGTGTYGVAHFGSPGDIPIPAAYSR